MVKMNGCAAIDFRPSVSLLADKAAVAADFHLEMALANMGNGE